MKSSGYCCPLVNSYHPRHPWKAEVAEPLDIFEGVSVVVPCTMKLMRQHVALLYEHSTEVKKQAGAKGQKEETCTMKLGHWMRQHEALLYEHSTEVKKQAGTKGQTEELGLMTLIVNDQALKPLALTCRRISCTHILLKE